MCWLAGGLICVLYDGQGVTGKHIKYDSRTESYVVDPMLQLPLPARDIVLCICELGWLYNKVSAYLKTVFQGGGPDSKGLIVQAFGFALQVPSLLACSFLTSNLTEIMVC